MELRVLDETLALARLAADAEVPTWVAGRDFLAVVRTPRELSIVCRNERCRDAHRGAARFPRAGGRWYARLRVDRIVASLAAPLAAAGISIFGISTYDTDHILVREDVSPKRKRCSAAAGHTFRQ